MTPDDIRKMTGIHAFGTLDLAFADFMLEYVHSQSVELFLASALVSQALKRGHTCCRLDLLAGSLYPEKDENDPENLPQIRLPDLQTWRKHLLAHSDAVSFLTEKDQHDLSCWMQQRLSLPADALETCSSLPDTESRTGGNRVLYKRLLKPLILDSSNRIYMQRYFLHEKSLAVQILQRCKNCRSQLQLLLPSAGLQSLHTYFQRAASDTDIEPDWQQFALFLAASQNFTVITGGPGTGKTTVAAALLALELQRNPDLKIMLAAPTGKAQMRLKEAIFSETVPGKLQISETIREKLRTLPGATIHSLLGYRFGSPSFQHNASEKLDLDLLIVDECSMVSLTLMDKLLQALPAQTRIVLLGDKDQLASVDAGSVIGDLCAGGLLSTADSEISAEKFFQQTGWHVPHATPEELKEYPLAGHIAELRQAHRFNREIGCISFRIKNFSGSEQEAMDTADQILSSSCGSFSARTVSRQKFKNELQKLVLNPNPDLFSPLSGDNDMLSGYAPMAELCRLAKLGGRENLHQAFLCLDAFKILCATVKGPFGVEAVNLLMRELLGMKARYAPGLPVMVRVNDAKRTGLVNGDTGIVWKSLDGPSGTLKIYFPNHPLRGFTPAELPPHEDVFAMTVHKSQGSGFQKILLLLPEQDSPVLSRELLYTGITRAKKRVDLWTTKAILSAALFRQTTRYSGLTERLRDSQI